MRTAPTMSVTAALLALVSRSGRVPAVAAVLLFALVCRPFVLLCAFVWRLRVLRLGLLHVVLKRRVVLLLEDARDEDVVSLLRGEMKRRGLDAEVHELVHATGRPAGGDGSRDDVAR